MAFKIDRMRVPRHQSCGRFGVELISQHRQIKRGVKPRLAVIQIRLELSPLHLKSGDGLAHLGLNARNPGFCDPAKTQIRRVARIVGALACITGALACSFGIGQPGVSGGRNCEHADLGISTDGIGILACPCSKCPAPLCNCVIEDTTRDPDHLGHTVDAAVHLSFQIRDQVLGQFVQGRLAVVSKDIGIFRHALFCAINQPLCCLIAPGLEVGDHGGEHFLLCERDILAWRRFSLYIRWGRGLLFCPGGGRILRTRLHRCNCLGTFSICAFLRLGFGFNA